MENTHLAPSLNNNFNLVQRPGISIEETFHMEDDQILPLNCCSWVLQKAATAIVLLVLGVFYILILPMTVGHWIYRRIVILLFLPDYVCKPYQGFVLAPNHFQPIELSKIPLANPQIAIMTLKIFIQELKEADAFPENLQDHNESSVSYADFIERFDEKIKILDDLNVHTSENIFGNALTKAQKIAWQNVLRHIIQTFTQKKEKLSGMKHETEKEKAKKEYLQELSRLITHMGKFFFSCTNGNASSLEDLYREFVITDPNFFVEHLEKSEGLVHVTAAALMQFRTTIFDQGCSIKDDHERAGTVVYARKDLGPRFGVPNDLSSLEKEYEFTADTDSLFRIIEFLNDQYQIPGICRYLGDCFISNDTFLKWESLNQWIDQYYRAFKDELIDNRPTENKDELIDNRSTENKDELIDNRPTENKDELIDNRSTENKDELIDNRPTENCMLLFAEDQGIIVYQGLAKEYPLAKYRQKSPPEEQKGLL